MAEQQVPGPERRTSRGLRRDRRRAVALRRGWRGAADRSAARLPRVLVRLAAADRTARGGGIPRGGTRHARLQPVLAAEGRQGLRHRPIDRRHPRSHPRTRCHLRAAGRPRLGRVRRLGYRDEVPQGVVDRLAILNAAHPRKLSQGLHHPGQLRKSWYFFFFDLPELPESVVHADRWHFFRHFLARRPPGLHAGGDRSLRRGVVPARRGHRDDQDALPVLGADLAEEGRSGASPDQGAHPGHLGGKTTATSAPNSPSPTTTTCPASTVWSACPTRRTGSHHDEAERVTQLLTDFFAPALLTENR